MCAMVEGVQFLGDGAFNLDMQSPTEQGLGEKTMGDMSGTAQGLRVTGTPAMDAADMDRWVVRIDTRLEQLTRYPGQPAQALCNAIRHSIRAPGKRLRALLLLSAFRELTPDRAAAGAGGAAFSDAVVDLACAVEFIHAASLIIDDLPAMDDASLRRGQPANHVLFGESTTILAGISILSQAFGMIAASPAGTPAARNRFVSALSDAVGVGGLAAGQLADLGRADDTAGPSLDSIHAQKTGALFAVAAEGGGLIAGAEADLCARLHGLGLSIGLAFQAFDDVLDAAGSAQHMGKDVGQDRRLGDEGGTVALARAGAAIRDHLQDVENQVNVLCRGQGALRAYTRHLRAALDRYLRLCDR